MGRVSRVKTVNYTILPMFDLSYVSRLATVDAADAICIATHHFLVFILVSVKLCFW